MQQELIYPKNVIPSLRFQFCPMCKTNLIRDVPFDDNIPRVMCPKCGWIQLLSNAIGVVIIAKNEVGIAAILPPGETGVGLPAGMVEYGEEPSESAIRELREETGLEAKMVDCLGWAFINRVMWPGPTIQIVYEAEIIGGKIKSSKEGIAKIFPLNEFPMISPSRIGSQKAMQMYLLKMGG